MRHPVSTRLRTERRAAPRRPAVPSEPSPDENSPGECSRLAKGRALAACMAGAPHPAREGLR